MELSARLKKEAEKRGMPAETLLMADLMAIGYTENEAYNIAYTSNAILSKKQNVSIRENITSTPDYEALVRERQTIIGERLGVPSATTSGSTEQLSKDEVASQLRRQIELLPDGSKEKADVLMKYADLFSYKKEEPKNEEEDVIRVWVPLTCDICPYKKNNKGVDQ